MTYRDPAPRIPRLWYVTLAFPTLYGTGTVAIWIWSAEASWAIEAAKKLVACASDAKRPIEGAAFVAHAVCGEDFADRERSAQPEGTIS